MNKARRKSLQTAVAYIDKAIDIVRDVKYEEQWSLDNIPENLQNSTKYEAMEDAIDNLEDVIDSLKEAYHSAEKAMD